MMTSDNERLEHAAEWLDNLDTLNELERSQFAEWLRDEANQRAFKRLRACHDSEELEAALSVYPSYAPPHDTMNTNNTKTRSRISGLWAWSAALCCMVLVAVVGQSQWQVTPEAGAPSPSKRIATQVAELRSLQTEDGSTLVLNAQTALGLHFSEQSRHAWLEQGEAYFDIARDTARPFVVHTPEAQISVLGTEFNIDHRAGIVLVSVTEGRVRVTADRVVELVAGEQVHVKNGVLSQVKHSAQVLKAGDWQGGWMDIVHAALPEVVARLQRYSDREIQLDPALSAQKISGRFQLRDPANTLGLIASLHQLELIETDRHFVLSEPQ